METTFIMAWENYMHKYRYEPAIAIDSQIDRALGYLDALEYIYPLYADRIRKEKAILISIITLWREGKA